jgi:hypothetical protein
MFKHIMVPVDLAHMETLEPTLAVVADMARYYDATITYVGITTGTPNSVARTPHEYEQKLEAFAQQQFVFCLQGFFQRLGIAVELVQPVDVEVVLLVKPGFIQHIKSLFGNVAVHQRHASNHPGEFCHKLVFEKSFAHLLR